MAAPPTFLGPDLFNPPPPRGWLTLTPSISIVGEYNDNIEQTRVDEQDDFILGLVPGLTLSLQRPEYNVLAGYNFTADFYAQETENNDVAKRQQFFADAVYRFSPRLTLTLLDRFIYDRDSNVVTASGISVGRRESWRNTLAPALRWQATPLTGLRLSASHTIIRFQEDAEAGGRDSDTYRVALGVDRAFTPRLSGVAEMGVAYLDPEDEASATTYTPRLGLEYQFTPTLRGAIRGGPSIVDRDGSDTEITPAVSADLVQRFRWGALVAGYDRAVTAEAIGLTDRQTIFASLQVPTLRRGLQLELTPRYTRADRERVADEDTTVESFTVNLRASYQIARNITIFGAYVFFHQEDENVTEDIDQNRVFFGLQYAYPINFQ